MISEKEVEEILDSLHILWCDYTQNGSVRINTLEKRRKKIDEIITICKVMGGIIISLAAGAGPGFPSTDIGIYDYPSGLHASIYLALGGLYRQSFSCLRDWMEMHIYSIYFGLVKYDDTYYDWLNGKYEAPSGRYLIKRLFERHEFWQVDKKFDLKNKLLKIYGQLCKYVHGGGLAKFDFENVKEAKIVFSPKAFDLWFSNLKMVASEIIFSYYVAYGADIVSEFYDEEEIKELIEILPQKYQQELENFIK